MEMHTERNKKIDLKDKSLRKSSIGNHDLKPIAKNEENNKDKSKNRRTRSRGKNSSSKSNSTHRSKIENLNTKSSNFPEKSLRSPKEDKRRTVSVIMPIAKSKIAPRSQSTEKRTISNDRSTSVTSKSSARIKKPVAKKLVSPKPSKQSKNSPNNSTINVIPSKIIPPKIIPPKIILKEKIIEKSGTNIIAQTSEVASIKSDVEKLVPPTNNKVMPRAKKLHQLLKSLRTLNSKGGDIIDTNNQSIPKLEPPRKSLTICRNCHNIRDPTKEPPLPKYMTSTEATANAPVRIPVGPNKEFLNIQYRPTANPQSTPNSGIYSSRYNAYKQYRTNNTPVIDLMGSITPSIQHPHISHTSPTVQLFQKSTALSRSSSPAPSTITTALKLRAIVQQFPPKDDIKILREKVEAAILAHRTFTVIGGYNSVRKALLNRGWIERFALNYCPSHDNGLFKRLQSLSIPELTIGVRDKENGIMYKHIIMSKLLSNHKVDFYWDFNRDNYKQFAINANCTLINVIRRGTYNYANKQGLCECLKQAHWFNNPGVSFLRHPRSYNLVNNGDPDDFINDFKVTAAMSLLKWILTVYEGKTSKLISETGKIPVTYFHFALSECNKFLQRLRHEDIDRNIEHAVEHEWQEFLDNYYKGVHVGNHFKESTLENEISMVHKSRIMLKRLRKYWSYVDMDGYMNIWILKPAFGSRGVGIYICRTLQYVLKVIKEHKESTYVIQKYIERPLLIHNTKFDIRQWFLISSTSPLTIWIYKECYLRFSSQTYNLRKLHESIHLTNNSVQSRYQNIDRDPALPAFNMWHSNEFKKHLETIGYPKVYDDIIYPGMRECITAAVLSNQEFMNTRKNSFELHGADFMITEDFKPWLIEINSRPALYASTPITSKMCPMVLEDCIKVVIDKARSNKATTGLFELLYQEKQEILPPPDPAGLQIMGKPTPANYFYTPSQTLISKNVEVKKSNDSLNISNTVEYMKYIGSEMKTTLKELLCLINTERARRKREAKIKNSTELGNLNYCDEMEKINTNIKEIEEIFKSKCDCTELNHDSSDILNQVVMMDLMEQENIQDVVDLPKTSDSVLFTNSKTLEKALDKIDKAENERTDTQNTLNSILGLIGNISFRSKQKTTFASSAAAILTK